MFKNIAFLGLGKMGSAMVEAMLKQGLQVTVYNRTQAKMLPLIEKGATGTKTLAEAVQSADVVMTSLLDDRAVVDVVTGPEGVLRYMPKSAVHIGTSTILPKTSQQIAKAHEEHGSRYIAATVLGIPKVALAGKLTTFCAGDPVAIDKVQPIFKAFSGSVVNLGVKHTLPNVMKICMNYSLITTMELICELYAYAEKSELDISFVQQGLHQIYGHPSFKNYIDKIKERSFDDVNFDMLGGNKDVTIFQEAFKEAGVSPKIGDIVKERFTTALGQGMDKKDWSAIYEIVRQESGL